MGRYQQDAKELLAAVGGLILGFRNCIDSMYLLENGTKTLVQVSQFWSGVDSFLWLIGEAIFHMLPVCICWSVTKKMGTTQSLGIVCTATSTTANSVGLGGLPGITAKLDYLKDLGVDYLWLTPFFPSPQRDNGYDVADHQGDGRRFYTDGRKVHRYLRRLERPLLVQPRPAPGAPLRPYEALVLER